MPSNKLKFSVKPPNATPNKFAAKNAEGWSDPRKQ